MKIYTKTGDKGETGLYGGSRISKASARVESYGNIDELNASIGVAKSHIDDENVIAQLKKIQFDLFTVGSEASTPIDKLFLANGKARLQYFILPGGGKAATFLHVARTVCRRAERSLVFLNQSEEVRAELIKYLNRLSDYLFVLARYVSKLNNEPEEYWNPNERK